MERIRYISSLFTFYLKREIYEENNCIFFKKPNTILLFIPMGVKTEVVPVNQIASTAAEFKVSVSSLLVGLLATVCGVLLLGISVALGIIAFVLAGLAALSAFDLTLTIWLTSGQVKVLSFFLFEKHKAELAASEITRLVAERLEDTNTRRQTDRIVDAINRK